VGNEKKTYASKDFVVRDVKEIEKMLLYEKVPEKKLVYLTMNRPDLMNAMPWPLMQRLRNLANEAEADPEVKVIVLRGAGEHFGVGDDIWEAGYVIGVPPGRTKEERVRPSIRKRLVGKPGTQEGEKWFSMRSGGEWGIDCIKPIIAQVQGYCYGMHLMIIMGCDIVIASEDALFTQPFWRYIGGQINWSLLIELVGLRKAQEMILTCRPLDADEAERFGLITKAVPRDKLEETVLEYAQVISILPGDAVAVGKMMCQLALQARGLEIGANTLTIGHCLGSHQQFDPDEWNFLKERRDKGVAGAVKTRDAMVPPRYRQSMKARKMSK
jgi:enoyl-CoA hydratase